jgi:hypothetical protein
MCALFDSSQLPDPAKLILLDTEAEKGSPQPTEHSHNHSDALEPHENEINSASQLCDSLSVIVAAFPDTKVRPTFS